jgi:hypothetical protein
MHPYCRIAPLLILLLTPPASAAPADPAQTCASYNQQSHRSAERLDRELQIANSPLLAADLAAGRNPKLAAYMDQFAADVAVHGLQGRPEPARIQDVKAHYQHVMGAATPAIRDPDSALQEDVRVVAGPMAAHRYHAALHVPGFPPDFAYYDAALPLQLRGQTIFDYGGPEGAIRERWSNHDNKFRTGQLWRYMLNHPRDADPTHFRTDLRPGSEAPGSAIDRDGDRLNAVFNGELALAAGDFSLVDGAFRYGPPSLPTDVERPLTEAEGLQFVKRWFSRDQLPVDTDSEFGWLADDAILHGAGCDDAAAANAPAIAGGAGSGRLAAQTLQRILMERVGPDIHHRLLEEVDTATPYGRLPVSGWSRVAFRMQLLGTAAGTDTHSATGRARVEYCTQWIMRLRAVSPTDVRAQEIWLDLAPLEAPAAGCAELQAH